MLHCAFFSSAFLLKQKNLPTILLKQKKICRTSRKPAEISRSLYQNRVVAIVLNIKLLQTKHQTDEQTALLLNSFYCTKTSDKYHQRNSHIERFRVYSNNAFAFAKIKYLVFISACIGTSLIHKSSKRFIGYSSLVHWCAHLLEWDES